MGGFGQAPISVASHQTGNVSRGVEDPSLTLNFKLGTLQVDYIPQTRKVEGLGFKV